MDSEARQTALTTVGTQAGSVCLWIVLGLARVCLTMMEM